MRLVTDRDELSCGLQNVSDILSVLPACFQRKRAAVAYGTWLAKQEIHALSLGS
jgi:hypothetical protein